MLVFHEKDFFINVFLKKGKIALLICFCVPLILWLSLHLMLYFYFGFCPVLVSIFFVVFRVR